MFLQLDFSNDVPIYLQIRNQVVGGIASGELSEGESLPTIRGLADQAGINMMTVSKAYQLLKSEGYIETDRRHGAIVKGMAGKHGLSKSSQMQLEVIASEAKLAGFSEEDFLEMCRKVFLKEDE